MSDPLSAQVIDAQSANSPIPKQSQPTMTPSRSQELALRRIGHKTNAYSFLINLPTVQFTNLMDLSTVELASLQGNKHNCGLCQLPNSSSEIMISGLRLPCNHTFCEECTFNWFHPRKFRNGCPSCYIEFFRIAYVDEDDDEISEDCGAEEDCVEGDDGEFSDGAQGSENDNEEEDEWFDIAHFDEKIEDRQTTGDEKRSVGEFEGLIGLEGRDCAAAATTQLWSRLILLGLACAMAVHLFKH